MRRSADIFDRTVGANVRSLRKRNKMTQPRAAEVLGVSYQSYQNLEAGKVTFTGQTLVKLSELFNVDLRSMIDGATPYMNNGAEAAYVSALMSELDKDSAKEIVRFATSIKANRG